MSEPVDIEALAKAATSEYERECLQSAELYFARARWREPLLAREVLRLRAALRKLQADGTDIDAFPESIDEILAEGEK